jgi:Tfp pilus assembly protein PilF
MATLAQLPPNQLYITEDFVREGRGNVRLRDAGARAGVKLYTIVPPEPAAPTINEPEPSTAELEAEDAAVAEVEAIIAAAARRKRMLTISGLALLTLVLIAGAAMMWKRGDQRAVAVTSTAPTGPQPATIEHPRSVLLAPFTVESPDPLVVERANAVRLGALEILRGLPELRVVETAAADTAVITARVRDGAAGPELVAANGLKAAPPAAFPDAASGIRALVPWVLAEVQARPRTESTPEALNSYADAVLARTQNDAARADASVRAALTADPKFLPAQLLAMEIFASTGKEADAIAAARQVVALDPQNLNAARKVARASLMSGDLHQAFGVFDLVLRREPKDAEVLNHAARYALAAGDEAKFRALLERMKTLSSIQIEAHEPDILAASGRIDAAIQRYYAIEETAADNSTLALKIGRLAVLRHSLPIAEVEQKKLEQSDPLYGYHVLTAYMAAEKGDRTTALKELDAALAAAVPGDESWTYAAEVHALLDDTAGVLVALEKAAQRKEPTASYVLAHPLFRYLANDPRFLALKVKLTEQQVEIRTALAQVR